MKKHIIIIAISFSVLFTSSCDRFLDLQPPSQLDNDFVFGSVSGANAAVTGVYHILLRLENGPFRNFAYTADDATGNYNAQLNDGTYSITRYDIRETNSILPTAFNALYVGVDRANVCIEEIPKMDLYNNGRESDQFELKRLLGEAYTLRALYYFELIKNWGDVPASFEPSINQPDLFLPREDRDVIYDRILADLELASDLLPWRSALEVERDERITKGAAKALRARIALFAGGYSLRNSRTMERPSDYLPYYEIAKDECFDLMQHREEHTLNPSYEAVFKNIGSFQKDPYGEILLEIGFRPGESGRFGFYENQYNYGSQSGGAPLIFALPTYFYQFDEQDIRRDLAICAYRPNFGTNVKTPVRLVAMYNGKFRLDWNDPLPAYLNPLYTGTNFPLIRFSDVLLMYAEAENELNGPTESAIEAYEEVRTRGFGGDRSLIGATPTNKDDFFEAVAKERLLEFGIEAIRKFDLIRWNRLASTIERTREELIKMRDRAAPYDNLPERMFYKPGQWEVEWGNSFYEPSPSSIPGYNQLPWTISLADGNYPIITNYAPYFEANKHELLPLPIQTRESNPKLEQDYGY